MSKPCFVCGVAINTKDIKCTNCGNEYYIVWYNLLLWLLFFHLFFMMFAYPIHNLGEVGMYLSVAITGIVWVLVYSFVYIFAVNRVLTFLFLPIATFQYFQSPVFDIYLDDYGVVSFPNMIMSIMAICWTLYTLINIKSYVSDRVIEKNKYVKLASGMYKSKAIAIVGRLLDKYKCDVDGKIDDDSKPKISPKPIKWT